MIIILAIIIFLRIIKFLIIFDIILSWLTLLGINFRPKFLTDLLNPIYKTIKNNLPTTFGPLDFTPIIILLFVSFAELFIFYIFPESKTIIWNLLS